MRRFHVWMAIGGLAALSSAPASCRPRAYSVNEHSTCAMGARAGRVASPCNDGSAMVYNPAGLARSGKGTTGVVVGGVTFIAPGGGFTDDVTGLKPTIWKRPGLPGADGSLPRTASPTACGGDRPVRPLRPRHPLAQQTPRRDSSAYKSVIRNIYLQPTLRPAGNPRVDVGGGFDFTFSHASCASIWTCRARRSHPVVPRQLQPLPIFGIPTGTDFADADIHRQRHRVRLSPGHHRPAASTGSPFGIRYLSRQKIISTSGT